MAIVPGEMKMKYCSKCGETKSRSEFHKNRTTKDGLKSWCKECCRAYQQSDTGIAVNQRSGLKFRRNNLEKTQERSRISGKKYRLDYPDRVKATKKKYRDENKEKTKASSVINNGIASGKITRPDHCESCFKECKPEAHHEDYSKPFDVDWLCKKCHSKLRRKVLV